MNRPEIQKNVCEGMYKSGGQVSKEPVTRSPQVTEQMRELAHAIECLDKEVSGMFERYRMVLRRLEPTEDQPAGKVTESPLVPLAAAIREMQRNVWRITSDIVTLKELCEL